MPTNKVASMTEAGKVAAKTHEALRALIKPGINVMALENLAKELILQAKMTPAFLGYKGYPAATCISINSTIVHGIPADRILKEGDIISIDLGVSHNGWLVDTARSYPVGRVKPEISKLISVTQLAQDEALKLCRTGTALGTVGHAIASTVKQAGFAIVEQLNGHGIGRKLWEPPLVPNYGKMNQGPKLTTGQTVAVEPITTLEPVGITVLDDGWTIVADQPNIVSCHIEDTIMITENGPVIFTRLNS